MRSFRPRSRSLTGTKVLGHHIGLGCRGIALYGNVDY
jgi:hypothetical protein